jgi:hypothetical protein
MFASVKGCSFQNKIHISGNFMPILQKFIFSTYQPTLQNNNNNIDIDDNSITTLEPETILKFSTSFRVAMVELLNDLAQCTLSDDLVDLDNVIAVIGDSTMLWQFSEIFLCKSPLEIYLSVVQWLQVIFSVSSSSFSNSSNYYDILYTLIELRGRRDFCIIQWTT